MARWNGSRSSATTWRTRSARSRSRRTSCSPPSSRRRDPGRSCAGCSATSPRTARSETRRPSPIRRSSRRSPTARRRRRPTSNPSRPMSELRIWNARAVDPGSATILDRATIAVSGDRIVEIAEAAGDAPAGAIDVAGRTVLPGFIDAHTHLSSDTSRSPGFGPASQLKGEDPRPRELGWFLLAKSCTAFLEAGITTVRDVGAYDDEAIVVPRAVELRLTPGPPIRTCGRIISATSPGGWHFGTMYEEADGPWEVRRAVRRQLRRGADFVKLMSP